MAYDPVERLREGNVNFLFDITSYDRTNLIERIRNLPDKNETIKMFLSKIIKYLPIFSFELIYDIDEFKKEVKYLLSSKNRNLLPLDTDKIGNIINKTSWGEGYIFRNLDKLLLNDELNRMRIIVAFIYDKSVIRKKWIDKLTKNKDMHKRALFIKNLIQLYPKEASNILNDPTTILEYKTEIGEQMSLFTPRINSKDLSEIVVNCLNSSMDKTIFENLKDYLLTHYKENDAGKLLLSQGKKDDKSLNNQIFAQNADQFFVTSKNYKYMILTCYSELISKQILEKYNNILKLEEVFMQNNRYTSSPLYRIYASELGNQLERVVDKYLSLSGTNTINFLRYGSMSSCFQLGDYVLKIGKGKWSFEEVICPNVYSILRNIEEFYIRDKEEVVIANLEVQPFLRRKATKVADEHFSYFHHELHDLGYYTDELKSRETTGDNFGILDSYKDADCNNPELLPDHFKKVPLVLYDRDRIFQVGKPQKVLREHFSY